MKKIYLFIMNLKSGKNFLPGLCFSYNKILPQNFCIKSVLQFIGGLFFLLLISSHGYSQGFTSKGKLLYKDTISLGERAAPDFADVDGDGDIDLFVGTDDYRIAIFTNDGNGNFEASGNFQYNDGVESVGNHPHPAFADLDGDSDLDLYLGYNGGAILVIEQISPEDFEEIGFLNVEGASFSVASNTSPYFVDLDRDADLDLAVGDANGVVHICYNDGGGVFTLHDTLEANGSYIDVGNNSSPAFGDADGDGDIDIYIGNEDGKIEIFSNDGSGIFSSDGYFTVNNETVDVGTFANPTFGNIDHDGVLELYIGNQDTTIYVFTNDGSGNFSANGVFRDIKGEIKYQRSGQYSSPEFVDLDGDDDLDLYIGNVDGYIAKYYNDESGIFDWGGFMQADENIIDVGDRAHPTFADLDNDNDLDLYVGESLGTVLTYTNDGSGGFTAAGAFQSDGSTLQVLQQANPVFADIDDDDDLDLYVGEYLGHIHVYQNDGAGTFSETDRLQAGGADIDVGEMPSPFFIDIDSDRDMDLYVSNYDNNILMFENNGEGTFSEGDTLKADGTIISANDAINIAFANLNGSCIPNLYLGNIFGNIYEYESFDITPPVITSEWTEFDAAGNENCEATLDDYISSLQVSDNCDSELDMVQTPASGTTLTYGDNLVKIIVTDDAGYSDSISFNVLVYDNIDPVITSTYDSQTLVASSTSCDATLPDYTGDVTAEDNCDLELDITQSPVAGSLISGSDQVITLIATDNDGNYAEYDFFVTVEDQTDPVITCPNDTTVTADSDGNFAAGLFLDPEVTDNCTEGAVPTVSNSYNSNSTLNDVTFSVGEYMITWTATDEASNTATCSVTLTVEEEDDEETGIFNLVKEGIVIYPNPISNALNVKLDDPSHIEEIRIYDVAGHQLYINESIFETKLIIDMNEYNSGLYLIQIKTIDSTFSKKIIKE